MLNKYLAQFYERDPQADDRKCQLVSNRTDLGRTTASFINHAGNLVLHLIGANSAHTGYARNLEFSQRAVPRAELILGLEKLITLIN